jgi:tetratricopeptide (TPR) repeat protein
MLDLDDPGSFHELLRRYQDRQADLRKLASHLERRIGELAARIGLQPMVVGTVTSLEEFADKAWARRHEVEDGSFLDMADLCLIEVTTHTRDQLPALVQAFEQAFELEDAPAGGDVVEIAGGDEESATRRFTVRLKPTAAAGRGRRQAFRSLAAELRLRTLLGHAWAQICVDLGRRNELRLPQVWRHELAGIASSLEECDWGLEAISEAIGTYGAAYSAYMTAGELEALAGRLEAVLEIAPKNLAAIERLIRTYVAIDDDDLRVRRLFEAHRARLQQHAPTLRDVGAAYCRTHAPESEGFAEGLRLLRKAVQVAPTDVDAVCVLGETLRLGGDRAAAMACFATGYSLDPSHPNPLSNCLTEALLERGDVEVIDEYRAMIPLAADRCQSQASAGINLPWAFFDLGLFHLSEERRSRAVEAFAAAIGSAVRGWMIRAAAGQMHELAARSVALPGLDTITWMLDLGGWAKASKASRQAAAWAPPASPVRFRKKVVVLVGDGSWEGELESPLVVLKEALMKFSGTVVGSGLRHRVGAVVGDLQEQRGKRALQSVAYVRQEAGPEHPRDARYSVTREVSGDAPFLAEALTFWQDLLAAGSDPLAVRVLSVGGGPAARCELQLALAFGARVGVLEGSDGAAGEALLEDGVAAGSTSPGQAEQPLRLIELTAENIVSFVEER